MIHREQIDLIKEKIDIAEEIGKRIELKANNTAQCPFHDDRHPSFSVNLRGQFWYCFSCCVGGDVIKFLELYEKKTFYEVLTELAQRTGITLKESTPEEKKQFEEKRIVEAILTETAKYYHLQLTEKIKDYLINKRKMTEESIEKFQIGFANGRLREQLLQTFTQELCLKAGVIWKFDNGNIVDFYLNRIIFPHLVRGRVVNLTGRIVEPEEKEAING